MDGTFRNNSLFFFLGILISKQIAPASLFSFQLRIKTPFRKNITVDSVIFFMEVKCKGNTQITHMEEIEKRHRWLKYIKNGLNRYKPDYLVTFLGFFHMYDLGVSYTFHFRKKDYRIIRNIFTEWCFDP